MYGKAFASMYTGSMFGAGMHVFAVWNYIIANADAKGYVEINPRMVAATLGGTATEVQSAIDYLSSSDENSRNADEGGRRVVREGQFLYRIVSYLRYREVRDMEGKRAYDRAYRRNERAGKQSSDDSLTNTTSSDDSSLSSQVEVEVKTISSNPSGFDATEAVSSTHKADDEKALHEVFAYYLKATDRNPKTYALTPARKRKGLARLRECLKKTGGDLEKAIGLMTLAVDQLAASDFHMGRDAKTSGKRYCDWEGHLFGSYERMERWWNS